MIKFSLKNKVFYDTGLNYPELPDDLVEVTDDQHMQLLTAINSGCIVFGDLSCSSPKPQFHTWNGTKWVDERTDQEIAEYSRSLLPKLSKRQFSLYLFDSGLYDQIMAAINSNPRFKIEFDTVSDIERLSPTVSEMSKLLGWTDEQVDEMWGEALAL